ncbi:MAG: hypothetical protein KF901_34980 [Myxococcales bacterium]|nr:hypothetical protein [Myxococcales bacterium]
MRLANALFVGAITCALGVACSSGDDLQPPASDAGPSPSPSEDAGVSPDADANVGSDAGAPKPLDVKCAGDPCYLAISGNGGRHVCGLLRDKTVRCWGRDTMLPATTLEDGSSVAADGALGRGRTVSVLEAATPAPVVGLSGVTQISVGPNLGACARTADGAVHCWGRNELGQLGRPTSEPSLAVPMRVAGIPPVDEVALGAQMGCAVASKSRALYCWGKTMAGLGVDAGESETFPPRLVTSFPAPVHALSVGTWSEEDTVVALLADSRLASLGRAAMGDTSSIPPWTSPLESLDVVRSWSFAWVAGDGLLRRWRPAKGTLYVPALAPAVDVKISGGSESSQGGVLLSTGRLFRWGDNTSGALGVVPESLLFAPHPLEVAQVGTKVVSFATTLGSTCASLVDGKVVCWGANTFGELGRGTFDSFPHPKAEPIE